MVPTDLEPFFTMLREIKPNPDWQTALREQLWRSDTGTAPDDVTFPASGSSLYW